MGKSTSAGCTLALLSENIFVVIGYADATGKYSNSIFPYCMAAWPAENIFAGYI